VAKSCLIALVMASKTQRLPQNGPGRRRSSS